MSEKEPEKVDALPLEGFTSETNRQAAQRNRERRREARRETHQENYNRAMRSVKGGFGGTELQQEMVDAAQQLEVGSIPTPVFRVVGGVILVLFLIFACFYAFIGIASFFTGM
ncbi:MAG: hypothetical protein VYE40_06555 [Myxococcota bacterium]|jgi:hypothetical protein|nr:hypothetical protein [Myxococcota bacterium]MEC9440739.1 hypothetical protein [Myxococcota bacterium]